MKKILIIEDEYDTAKMLKKRIEGNGYQVAVAYDSYSGSAAVGKEMPDLVILDLMLPARGGESVFDSMKRNDATKGIPVIVVTGIMDEATKKELYTKGIADYIEKPYKPERLMSSIRTVLGEDGQKENTSHE
jgi:DNA-binding response OmpR family regulator